jgi:N-acetylmuramic acid 6-phosphate etherase
MPAYKTLHLVILNPILESPFHFVFEWRDKMRTISLTQRMSVTSDKRSEEFLKISGQFKLGALVTESSHPVTANLSDVAKKDIAAALNLLFEADGDVIKNFRDFVVSRQAEEIKDTILRLLKNGGRIFFTGCGSTGRLSILLDSVWRDFWQQQAARDNPPASDWENRTFSVMAGGDYALIKSVEGFEDFTDFGKKQINDLDVSSKDIVFAITEGGETSFVIGTAWAGVEAGAKVYFVYNNPDDLLCEHVQRSREVIQDSRIEKINLTTGPMSITGSTRMQATSIQLCVMLTVLEMTARELVQKKADGPPLPSQFLAALEQLHANLKSPEVLASLAELVALEESVYRSGHKNNYFADRFGIDVLTDTTERSPTYCTPPFRKFDDTTASESWAFLFLPQMETPRAWQNILKRAPRCVEWREDEVRNLAGDEKLPHTMETIRKISRTELMRFKIGLDGLPCRDLKKGDCAVAVMSEREKDLLFSRDGFFRAQHAIAQKAGAKTGLIYLGTSAINDKLADKTAFIPLPETDFLLDGIARIAVKLVMNTLSTCTMVRLGCVMGNTMIRVVPSNLKLIDRATRYISRLAGLDYAQANRLLFEVIEYVEPRLKSDRAYPPVVGLAVLRAKENLSNEEAEKKLNAF